MKKTKKTKAINTNKNKNKNNIHININSHNKRRGTTRKTASPPTTIFVSTPHVPYVPQDSSMQHLYPILQDIKDKVVQHNKPPIHYETKVEPEKKEVVKIKAEPLQYQPIKVEPSIKVERHSPTPIKLEMNEPVTIRKANLPKHSNSVFNQPKTVVKEPTKRPLRNNTTIQTPEKWIPHYDNVAKGLHKKPKHWTPVGK